ncbi:MAG: cobalamin-binding protein [Betaproteobacteria bacterium]|nr:cobalamin-binding protein [Betaproteobacteria bacterium]
MRLLVFAALLACALGARAAVNARDDTGHLVRVPAPAKRVVSLAPNLTELVFAAGAGDRVVGVISGSDYPPAARRLPRVGIEGAIDPEAVLALRPDLVVAWPSAGDARVLERLAALGIPVFRSEPRSLDDIAHTLETLGRLTGRSAPAEAAARDFRERLARLEREYSGRAKVGVFYEVWDRPLMTVGARDLITQVIRLCGGENVFAHLPGLAPQIDREAVLRADPEAIVASGTNGKRPAWLDDWRAFPSLLAVQRDNLFFVPPDLLQRDTPRILEGADRLCADLDAARARRPR